MEKRAISAGSSAGVTALAPFDPLLEFLELGEFVGHDDGIAFLLEQDETRLRTHPQYGGDGARDFTEITLMRPRAGRIADALHAVRRPDAGPHRRPGRGVQLSDPLGRVKTGFWYARMRCARKSVGATPKSLFANAVRMLL